LGHAKLQLTPHLLPGFIAHKYDIQIVQFRKKIAGILFKEIVFNDVQYIWNLTRLNYGV